MNLADLLLLKPFFYTFKETFGIIKLSKSTSNIHITQTINQETDCSIKMITDDKWQWWLFNNNNCNQHFMISSTRTGLIVMSDVKTEFLTVVELWRTI